MSLTITDEGLPMNTMGQYRVYDLEKSTKKTTQKFLNGGSVKERLCKMVKNYRHLYDVFYQGQRDKNQITSSMVAMFFDNSSLKPDTG